MKYPALRLALAAILTLPFAAAHAGDPAAAINLNPPKSPHGWYVRGAFDLEFPVSGKIHGGLNTSVPAAAVGLPSALGALPVNIQKNDFSDVYNALYGGSLQIGYDFGNRFTLFGSAGYIRGNADSVGIGSIAGSPAFVQFDDYQAWRFFGGIRYDLTEGSRWRPYVEWNIGASRTGSIDAAISVPGASVILNETRFYKQSTTVYTGANFGLAYAVTPNFELGIETGITYQSNLKQDDSNLSPLGFQTLNDKSSFYTIPIRFYGSCRF